MSSCSVKQRFQRLQSLFDWMRSHVQENYSYSEEYCYANEKRLGQGTSLWHMSSLDDLQISVDLCER